MNAEHVLEVECSSELAPSQYCTFLEPERRNQLRLVACPQTYLHF